MAIPRNDSEFLRKARELGIPLDPEGLGRYAQEYGLGNGQPVSYAPGARFGLLRELVLRRLESEGVDVGSSIETRAEAEQAVLARNVGATRRSRASYYREANFYGPELERSGITLSDEQIVQAGERANRVRDMARSRQQQSEDIIAQEKQALEQGYVRRDVFYSQDGGLNFMYFQAGQNDLFSKMPKQYASGLYSEAPENRVSDPYYFPSPYKPFDIDLTDLESSETSTTTKTGRDLLLSEELEKSALSSLKFYNNPNRPYQYATNAFSGAISGGIKLGFGALTQAKEIQDALFSKQKSSMIASLSLKYALGAVEFTTKELPRQATSKRDFGEALFNIGTILEGTPKNKLYGYAKSASKGFFKFGKFVETGVTRSIPEALDRADIFGGKPIYDSNRIRPTVRITNELLYGETRKSNISPPQGITEGRKMTMSDLYEYENSLALERRMKKHFPEFASGNKLTTTEGFGNILEGETKGKNDLLRNKETGELSSPSGFWDFAKENDFEASQRAFKRAPELVNSIPEKVYDPNTQGIFPKNEIKNVIDFENTDAGFIKPKYPKKPEIGGYKIESPDPFLKDRNEYYIKELVGESLQGISTSGLEFYKLDYLNNRPIGKTKNIIARNAKGLLFGTTILAGAGVLSVIDPVNAKVYAGAGIIGATDSFSKSQEYLDYDIFGRKKRKGPRIRIRDDFDSPEAYFPSRSVGKEEVYDQYRDLVESERKGRIVPSRSLMADVLRYSPRVSFKTEIRAKSEQSLDYLALSRFKTDTLRRSKQSTESLTATKTAFDSALRYDLLEKTKTKTVKPIRPFSPNYGGGDYGDFDLIKPPKRIEEPPPNNPRTNDDYFFNRPTGRSRKSFTVSRGFRYSPDITSYIAGFKTSKKRGAFSIGEVRPFYQPKKSKRSRK